MAAHLEEDQYSSITSSVAGAAAGDNDGVVGNYKVIQLLKEHDTFSEYLSEQLSTGVLTLLRVYPLAMIQKDPKLAVQIEREVVILRKTSSHPFIASLKEVFTTTLELFVAIEYCEGGELFEVVETFNENAQREEEQQQQQSGGGRRGSSSGGVAPSGIPRKVVGRLFHEIVMAVSYLHSQGFCHRDIKLENVWLSATNQVKLAEFSMATSIAQQQHPHNNVSLDSAGGSPSAASSSHNHGVPPQIHQKYTPTLSLSCGSMHYACPEVIDGVDYDGRCADVWSLGVVLFTLVTGVLPFEGPVASSSPQKKRSSVDEGVSPTQFHRSHGDDADNSGPSLFDKIRRADHYLPAHPSFAALAKDDPARELLISMLQVQPTKRMTMRSILRHAFWKSCNVDTMTQSAIAAAGFGIAK